MFPPTPARSSRAVRHAGAVRLRNPGVPRQFDHSDHIARYNSMLAQALADARKAAAAPPASVCVPATGDESTDSDGDGLVDAFDAAPHDAGEFVRDANNDGFFEICNIRQFQAIGNLGTQPGSATTLDREVRMARNYQLVRDLDASGVENFEPIGDCGPAGNCMISLDRYGFQGVIDGQGHAIRGLRISRPGGSGIGLIGVLGARGTVRNLAIEDAVVIGRGGVGLLVGSNFGMVYRCRAEGEVAGELALGVLVGGSGGMVAFSESAGSVSGSSGHRWFDRRCARRRVSQPVERPSVRQPRARGAGGPQHVRADSGQLRGRVGGGRQRSGRPGGDEHRRQGAQQLFHRGRGGGRQQYRRPGGVQFPERCAQQLCRGRGVRAEAVGGLVGRNNGSIRRSYSSAQVRSSGSSGGISGFAVDGEEDNNFWSAAAGADGASMIAKLTAEQSGWSLERGGYLDLIDVYCDSNLNGFIDPDERHAGNLAWDFDAAGQPPAIRCAASAGASAGGG